MPFWRYPLESTRPFRPVLHSNGLQPRSKRHLIGMASNLLAMASNLRAFQEWEKLKKIKKPKETKPKDKAKARAKQWVGSALG